MQCSKVRVWSHRNQASYAMAYSCSGRLAFAGVAALWVWAASTAFVSSNNGAKALRGVERGSNAEYTPFAAAPEMGEQNVRSVNSGMQAVLLAGVVGLMAGLAPVRAEEAAPAEAAPAPATESSFSFEKKRSRPLTPTYQSPSLRRPRRWPRVPPWARMTLARRSESSFPLLMSWMRMSCPLHGQTSLCSSCSLLLQWPSTWPSTSWDPSTSSEPLHAASS